VIHTLTIKKHLVMLLHYINCISSKINNH